MGGAAENLYNSGIAGPREITVSVQESAIFVEDFRVPEGPGGGGPVDASRVSPNRSVGERVL